MELFSSRFNSSLGRYWRRRRYQRLDGTTHRKNIKVIRIGGRNDQRFWKIRAVPKLRVLRLISPLRLWTKFKNAYVNMMLGLGGKLNNGNIFGEKRIPKARDQASNSTKYSNEEFHNRLVYEIYKNLLASRELATT